MRVRTEIVVCGRGPDQLATDGIVTFPDGRTASWARAGLGRPVEVHGKGGYRPGFTEKELTQLIHALRRDPVEKELRLKRRAGRADPWPLEKLPAPGAVMEFGGKSFRSPLDAETHAIAVELREAAKDGEDFPEMMDSIRDAGFDILPILSGDGKKEPYGLIGFRFSRDGADIPASHASLMIRPLEGEPRAPDMSRDIDLLLSLRDEYDGKHRDRKAATDQLRREVSSLMKLPLLLSDLVDRFRSAGISATIETKRVSDGTYWREYRISQGETEYRVDAWKNRNLAKVIRVLDADNRKEPAVAGPDLS